MACFLQCAAELGQVGESQEASLRDNGMSSAGQIQSIKRIRILIAERTLQVARKSREPFRHFLTGHQRSKILKSFVKEGRLYDRIAFARRIWRIRRTKR